MRTPETPLTEFLSIQAQDFIEETSGLPKQGRERTFLSIQAQDFIEDCSARCRELQSCQFLSIQAQDFIEDFEKVTWTAC